MLDSQDLNRLVCNAAHANDSFPPASQLLCITHGSEQQSEAMLIVQRTNSLSEEAVLNRNIPPLSPHISPPSVNVKRLWGLWRKWQLALYCVDPEASCWTRILSFLY